MHHAINKKSSLNVPGIVRSFDSPPPLLRSLPLDNFLIKPD